MNGREMWQWWTLLSEGQRQEILVGIPGCKAYGIVKTRLSEMGNEAVASAYAKHRLWVAEMDAQREAKL